MLFNAYGYNARSELISSARTGGSPSLATEHEYGYDPIGNRTSSSDLGTTRAYTANSLNQYTEISTLRASAPPHETFIPQFDDDGNQTLIQTKTGVWSVTYNGENRPIQWSCVASNSSTPNSSTPSLILMSFDLMGRRVSYTETVGVVTNAHRTFVYDNYLQIANSEHTTSNSQLFVWDPTEPVATRPLVWHHNGGTCFYTHDGNKNVSELVDGNGAVTAHYEYAPFGDVTAAVGNLAYANRFRFSCEYADDTLGLVYYNYRHYEPVLGRWIRRDPIGMFWVENVYGVCNYIQYYDHLGLTKISWDDFKKVEKNSNLEFVSIIALEWSYTANELGTEVTPLTGDDCLNAKKVRDNGRPYVDVECPCAECYEVQSFYKDAIVTVSINHEKSYVKKFALDDLDILAHEQLHVTISEKMALKASEELRKVKGAKVKFCNLESGVDFAKKNPPSESSLDNKFKELYLQEQNMQNQYDNETEHGSIPQKQKEWEDKWK